ncbi:MAG TPA: hypothetical protein PK293_14040 [Spirochaetota bacterium]|nr:hypothetical protein [Spirochaetota bacterium]HPF07155.1 hypothetical protein [Spirochaetota bacterium]HPJ43431.1 hypothetical protein [Spirochaetota bacterium]HPR38260.1 hypothetical protein [Spirochaetota bacterium]
MTQNIIVLTDLPEEAKKEVVDFYEFIKTKYPHENIRKYRNLSKIIPRVVPAFTPLTREQANER